MRCAVAEAFSEACAKGDDVKVEDFHEVFRSEDAFAFAQVRLLTTTPLHTAAETNSFEDACSSWHLNIANCADDGQGAA